MHYCVGVWVVVLSGMDSVSHTVTLASCLRSAHNPCVEFGLIVHFVTYIHTVLKP